MAMDHSPLLEVTDLNVELNNHTILEHVSFVVQQGEVVAIVGPNGAGKSTLFRVLLGLTPHSGTITWHMPSQGFGEVKIGYVPQHLDVERNFPITVSEFLQLKQASHKEMHDSLDAVGLASDVHRRALGVLSGGELQRVLIAWALIGNPTVLLFDEPTAGIDMGGEKTIYHLLHQIKTERNLTILLITHDDHVVDEQASSVLALHKKMIFFGPAHTYHHDHPTHH